MADWGEKAKQATKMLRRLDENARTKALRAIASEIRNSKSLIQEENSKDMKLAEEADLNSALKDRLCLSPERIEAMARGVEEIAEQKQVVGSTYAESINASGVKVAKQRIPLGVILMIFESRPNVVIDCAALAIKSGNAILLKGGKEAKYSNECLGNIIHKATSGILPEGSVLVLNSSERDTVNELLTKKEYIDLVIPRGGKRLIEHVYENAKMPVIAHFEGLCHMFIDESADLKMAVDLIVNAKTQRTGVCNALETLVLHEAIVPKICKDLVVALEEKSCELRVDKKFKELTGFDTLKDAKAEDWATEYLDNILSIKCVGNLAEAIDHIDTYGTFHTEAIVSEDLKNVEEFFRAIDASCVVHNASTRFNDGGQLGLGAELGISTTKIHAYGPMGAEEMTSSRFILRGTGQLRS